MKQPVIKWAGLALVAGLSAACTAPRREPPAVAPTAQARQEITADSPLIDIDVAQSRRRDGQPAALPGPPPFREEEKIAQACRPGVLAALQGAPWLSSDNVAKFDRMMATGLDMARARHAWDFHMQRSLAQRSVSGMDTGGPNFRQKRAQPAGDAATADRLPPRQRPGTTTPPSTTNPNPAQITQVLEYNAAVLAAQDKVLKEKERAYAASFADIYQETFEAFAATFESSPRLKTVLQFDRFRSPYMEACALRGLPERPTLLRTQNLDVRYRQLVLTAVANDKAGLIASMKSARDETALSRALADLTSSEYVSWAAFRDPDVSTALRQQRETIAALAAERDALERRQAAEELNRQTAARRAAFERKAAGNVPPTHSEILSLHVGTYAQLLSEYYRSVRQTGVNEVTVFNPVFDIPVSIYKIDLGPVDCRPEGNKQRCKYSVTLRSSGLVGFERKEMDGNRHALFRWETEGLAEDGLKTVYAGPIQGVRARELRAEIQASEKNEQDRLRRSNCEQENTQRMLRRESSRPC